MKKLLLAAMLAASPSMLASCATVPADIADQTVLDEKTGIAIETAYTAAATAARFAIEAKVVTPAQAQQIAALDHQAYAVVLQTRAAYDAGNAASYDAAAAQALPIIRKLVATVRGE